MNHRLVLLAIVTGLFAAAWSTDRGLTPTGNSLASSRLCRTPIASVIAANDLTGKLGQTFDSGRSLGWSQRVGRDTPRRDTGFSLSEVWPSRSDELPDYWRFGCGRFEDGATLGSSVAVGSWQAGGTTVSESTSGFRFQANDGRSLDIDRRRHRSDRVEWNARQIPLPWGIVPGVYAVLEPDGGMCRVVFTRRGLRNRRRYAGTPSGYYLHTDAEGTWHFFQVQADSTTRMRLALGRPRLMSKMYRQAGQRLLGPLVALPVAEALRRAGAFEPTAESRWLDLMAQEIGHAMQQIEQSSRYAIRSTYRF